jgi:hypothetical protein
MSSECTKPVLSTPPLEPVTILIDAIVCNAYVRIVLVAFLDSDGHLQALAGSFATVSRLGGLASSLSDSCD